MTLTIFSVMTRMLGFLYRVILSRAISTETLGVYTITLSIFMVFCTIISSGLPLVISRIVSINAHSFQNNKTNKLISTGVVIGTVASIALSILILCLKGVITRYFLGETGFNMLLCLLPALVGTGIYSSFRGYLWGKEHFFMVGLVEFVEQIIKILISVLFFFVIFGFDISLVPSIAISTSTIASTVLGMIFYFKSGGRLSKPDEYYKPIIKSALPLSGIKICNSIIPLLTNLILPIRLITVGYSNSQALSVIGIICGMTLPLLSIPVTIIGSLAMAIMPKFTALSIQKNTNTLHNQIQSALNFTIFTSFIILPIFLSLGVPICELLFGSTTAGEYLVDACFILVPNGIAVFTTSVLNSMGLEQKTFKIFMISSVVLLAILWIFPTFTGVSALIYGMGANMSLVSILNMREIQKSLHKKIKTKKLLICNTLVCLPIALLLHWSYGLMSLILPTFISLAISASLGLVCFPLLLSAFNLIDITYIKTTLVTK